MNILFLSLLDFDTISENNIYTDLLRTFCEKGDNVFVISPIEKRKKRNTYIIKEKNATILKLRIGNIQKTNLIEKGLSTLTIEQIVIKGIKKYFSNIKFDLIIYSTPPITFCRAIEYVKKRDNAKTYLLLKDIFPQNAVDIKILKKTGIKSIIYKYFRKKEKKLYNISDKIGCMSKKNIEYLIKNNEYIDKNKVEVFPNCISPKKEKIRNNQTNLEYRKKYNIPINSQVFIYGGNLGKPQGVGFIIECLKKIQNINNIYFVICGTGTEYKKIEEYKKSSNIKNLLLINGLPKKEYDAFLNVADIGLIFLDYNFTIPNFPSRILSYMEKGIPILCCTDLNTDIGDIVVENDFGWKCYSNDSNNFLKLITEIKKTNNDVIKKMGSNANKYLYNHYSVEKNIKKIKNIK